MLDAKLLVHEYKGKNNWSKLSSRESLGNRQGHARDRMENALVLSRKTLPREKGLVVVSALTSPPSVRTATVGHRRRRVVGQQKTMFLQAAARRFLPHGLHPCLLSVSPLYSHLTALPSPHLLDRGGPRSLHRQRNCVPDRPVYDVFFSVSTYTIIENNPTPAPQVFDNSLPSRARDEKEPSSGGAPSRRGIQSA